MKITDIDFIGIISSCKNVKIPLKQIKPVECKKKH